MYFYSQKSEVGSGVNIPNIITSSLSKTPSFDSVARSHRTIAAAL